jgi:endo-1,4-beta-xylanase
MDDISPNGVRERIRKIRFADVSVRALRGDGKALSNAEVRIGQTAHEFLFGQTGMELIPSPHRRMDILEQYKAIIGELYNAATLPFYWGRFEPEEGRPRTDAVMEAARWFKDRGFFLKGHPLCWHTVCADWLMKYPNHTILEKQRERVRRDVSAFSGLIDAWDVINETVIMPVYDRYDNAVTRIAKEYGAVPLADMLFREARDSDPRAMLLINDFDLGPEYERNIESLLEKGAPMDAVGLQTHQHQGYRGARRIWDYAERFSRFGLPLHFTETTIISGKLMPAHIMDLNDYAPEGWASTPEGEERQAREVVEYYSLLYSHPAVRSIIWWGISDGGWLNAPCGLLRRDMSPKPAYGALKALIKGEWWTPEKAYRTDADGTVRLTCAPGSYELRAAGGRAAFKVPRDSKSVEARLG